MFEQPQAGTRILDSGQSTRLSAFGRCIHNRITVISAFLLYKFDTFIRICYVAVPVHFGVLQSYCVKSTWFTVTPAHCDTSQSFHLNLFGLSSRCYNGSQKSAGPMLLELTFHVSIVLNWRWFLLLRIKVISLAAKQAPLECRLIKLPDNFFTFNGADGREKRECHE